MAIDPTKNVKGLTNTWENRSQGPNNTTAAKIGTSLPITKAQTKPTQSSKSIDKFNKDKKVEAQTTSESIIKMKTTLTDKAIDHIQLLHQEKRLGQSNWEFFADAEGWEKVELEGTSRDYREPASYRPELDPEQSKNVYDRASRDSDVKKQP